GYDNHHDLHSFPTRRSSDLTHQNMNSKQVLKYNFKYAWLTFVCCLFFMNSQSQPKPKDLTAGLSLNHEDWIYKTGEEVTVSGARSEEHTSELQSRENLVCRL